jgi:DNA-binding NarL/FixJ family response regulator
LELPPELESDVVLADANLPTINNVHPTILIRQWNPAQRVLILSDSTSPLPAIRAFRNGASGYMIRMEDFDHLSKAIHKVFLGGRYLSQSLTDQVLDSVIVGKNYEDSRENNLTAREREILQLTAEGKTNAEIGTILVISKRTVETHRNHLMKKLGLSSQIDIVRYALKQGLISID